MGKLTMPAGWCAGVPWVLKGREVRCKEEEEDVMYFGAS